MMRDFNNIFLIHHHAKRIRHQFVHHRMNGFIPNSVSRHVKALDVLLQVQAAHGELEFRRAPAAQHLDLAFREADGVLDLFEDRLRMIRAFRFSARFGFAIELATQEAITENATYLFPSVAQERVWQELTKMAAYPRFDVAVAEMHRLHILQEIFPELAHLHLQELRQRVSSFRHFPQNTPTLLYLAELFEGLELEEKVAIAKRISAPNREIKLMEHMHALFPRLQRGLERNVETLHLLAHSATELGIKLFVANLQEEERALVAENIYRFLEENQDLIGRVREKRPLVCAADLMKRGIAPGRKMGEWLKQAEKVAVEKGCATKEEVFQCLPQFEV